MEIIERIFKTLNSTDKKAVDLANLLNVSTSTMSTWKTRKTDPPAKYMPTVARFLGVSLEYLLTGSETTTVHKSTTPAEDSLLDLFRALPENKQYEFIGELKGFLKALDDTQKYLDSEKRLLV